MSSTRASDTSASQQDTRERSLWSRPWFVLSLALVLVLVGCAIWLMTTDPDTTPGPGQAGGTSSSAQADASDLPGCGPAGTGSQVTDIGPPAATWRLVGTMAAPSAEDIGPATTVDGIGLCYSADPTGALFAAANFVATSSDPSLRYSLFNQATAPGPGRDEAIVELAVDPGTATPGVQIAGFSFIAYEQEESATVDLVLLDSGSLTHLPLQLTWISGDWRVALPPTGRPYDYLQNLDSMSGYTPWQGA